MKIKNIITAILTVGYTVPAFAISSHTLIENDSTIIKVDFIADNIVRVKAHKGLSKAKQPSLVADIDKVGFNQPEVKQTKMRGDHQTLLESKNGIKVLFSPGTMTLGFFRNNKIALYSSPNRRGEAITITPSTQCSFYGGGERGYSLNLAGDTLVNFNRQNYGYTDGDPRIRQMGITMPYVVSSAGFGVFFDDFCASRLSLANNEISYSTESDADIDYYLFFGDIENIVTDFTRLVGRQDIAPFWSLGYITSRYGYHNRKETEAVVDSIKAMDLPLDGMVFDLYWYGKEQDMGRLAWDADQWPNHKEMLARLKKRGVNTVTISQPYVLTNGRAIDNYRELAPKGLLCRNADADSTQEVTIWVGHGGMFDVSNPLTQLWLRNRYKNLTDEGVTGWWGDLGEPEVHPETIIHKNGLTARQYHNLYGNDWSRIIYDLFRDEYPDRRLMTMMRAGTAGLQRYSVFPWSTDVSRSWGGLQPQVKIMVNSGLSGLGFMSHDVGGFAIDPTNPRDDELYVRWLQLGVFSPILRTHSQYLAEPYNYSRHADIIKHLIRERYRWLPYNYTLAYENASKGLPFVRPLGLYDNDISRFDNISDQYLWGHDVMVAPILSKGTNSRSITFPKGKWIDYNNPCDKPYFGGTTINYPVSINDTPLFVRVGAFIPLADYEMDNVADYDPSRLLIKYFPAETLSEYTLFEDDRSTPHTTETGDFRLIRFEGNDTPITTTIKISSTGDYKGAPAKKTLKFEIPMLNKPQAIKVNGKPLKSFDLVENHSDYFGRPRAHQDNSTLIFEVKIKNITKVTTVIIEK